MLTVVSSDLSNESVGSFITKKAQLCVCVCAQHVCVQVKLYFTHYVYLYMLVNVCVCVSKTIFISRNIKNQNQVFTYREFALVFWRITINIVRENKNIKCKYCQSQETIEKLTRKIWKNYKNKKYVKYICTDERAVGQECAKYWPGNVQRFTVWSIKNMCNVQRW